MSSSFIERKISVAVALAQNQTNQPQTFAESGTNQVTLDGHRASVRIQNSGAAAGSHAQVVIWGMSQSLMDQMSTLGMVLQMVPRNTLTVTAGDSDAGMSTIFVGTILNAWADFNSAPEVAFHFECLAGAAEAAIPYPATSYSGSVDAATIFSAIASKMGWGFENSGVSVQLQRPYLAGSAMDQVRTLMEHAHVNASLLNNVLCVWPLYGARKGAVASISPTTGMILYPGYTQQGIVVRSLFDPRIAMGGQLQVQSSLQKASGTWNVLKLDVAVDALLPKGKWEQTAWCYNPKFPAPLPPQTGG